MKTWNLASIRMNNDKTQEEMAELYGIPYRRYQDIENGRCKLNADELMTIAKFNKMSPEEIRF